MPAAGWMLGIRGAPQADLREHQRVGRNLRVAWFDIEDVDPDATSNASPDSVFGQSYGQGGAKFNRLEGWWDGDDSIYFVSTRGGDVKNGDVNSDGFAEGDGQIWRYRARGAVAGTARTTGAVTATSGTTTAASSR